MPEFNDSGHRPHADYKGETPTTGIDRGPYGLKVSLDQWGPWNTSVMDAYLHSNWGEHPVERAHHSRDPEVVTPLVEACLEGKTLQQILEGITFWFTIDGVCRPATHQIVRTRDAAFMQHGGRDNDWRHRRFSMPETIWRACQLMDPVPSADPRGPEFLDAMGLKHCITDAAPLDKIVYSEENRYLTDSSDPDLTKTIEAYLAYGKKIYAALVDAGIPWQDARRLLPMGLQTYIHGIYDFRTLQHTLGNRLEFIMDWEYNCVGQLMIREIRRHCPKEVAAPFMSTSDRMRKAAFADLGSWPPDGKYQATQDQIDMIRAHRREQNPFWVLTEDALNGGPVEWIATNGTYPHENPKAPKPR
jgi:thymidylate synthase ThyX